MIYVGRLLPGGRVPGMEGVHRAPRREPGSGVLVGLDQSERRAFRYRRRSEAAR